LHNIIYLIEGTLPCCFGGFSDKVKRERKMICSAMASLQVFKGFSVMRTNSLSESAEWIIYLANHVRKTRVEKQKRMKYGDQKQDQDQDQGVQGEIQEQVKEEKQEQKKEGSKEKCYAEVVHKTKKENVTPQNIGAIMLAQIPGISGSMATELLSPYDGNLMRFLEDVRGDPQTKLFRGVMPQSKKKIRSNVAEAIENLLLQR
jgi:ERCC4-type nuclease